MTLEERRALRDANGRLLAALGRVGPKCGRGDRSAVLELRLGEPAIAGGYDPVGLLHVLTEAVAVLAEATDVALTAAAAKEE